MAKWTGSGGPLTKQMGGGEKGRGYPRLGQPLRLPREGALVQQVLREGGRVGEGQSEPAD